jgi:hypothetical protein
MGAICAVGLAVANLAASNARAAFANETCRHGVALVVGFVLTLGAVRARECGSRWTSASADTKKKELAGGTTSSGRHRSQR